MPLEPAPFYGDISYGPQNGAAHWVKAADGTRIRIGHWPLAEAIGTVFIFPGRTEFVEKYGQTAAALADRGYASVAIDWRGQGLADRLLDNKLVGHVDRFLDYQLDVAAMIQTASELDMPRPFFLLAHSMGGAIGLRALVEGMDVQAVAFSGPMWGIKIAPHLRPLAWTLGHIMPRIGHGHRLPPGTQLEHHVLTDGFDDNLLTRDRVQFDIMHDQLVAHPELALGGPSFVWLREALMETRRLASIRSPDLPCITFLGSNERIVEVSEIHRRMTEWPGGDLQIVQNGEHEVLMERSEVSGPIFDQITELFRKTAAN